MSYHVEGVSAGENPHVNYEPSSRNGLSEHSMAGKGKVHEPVYVGSVMQRKAIERTNNFGQAGMTYRQFEAWEKDGLVSNLVNALKTCNKDIQHRMVYNFTQADKEYGTSVAKGLHLFST